METTDTIEKKISFTSESVRQFAELTGDFNPIHLDEDFAKQAGFPGCIVHGMLAACSFAGILASDFPGEGSVLLSQNTTFRKPILVNAEYSAKGFIKNKRVTYKGKTIYTFLASMADSEGNILLEAEIAIMK